MQPHSKRRNQQAGPGEKQLPERQPGSEVFDGCIGQRQQENSGADQADGFITLSLRYRLMPAHLSSRRAAILIDASLFIARRNQGLLGAYGRARPMAPPRRPAASAQSGELALVPPEPFRMMKRHDSWNTRREIVT